MAGCQSGDVRICPWCSCELPADGICASCGKRLEPGDWPVKEAYSPDGLQATAADGLTFYSLPAGEAPARASLCANPRLPRGIPEQDPLSVGNTLRDSVRIETPVPVRAVFYRNLRSGDCWVLDQSRFASLRVNGKPERNRRLRADDVVDIAGVRLVFDGECIGLPRDEFGGVTLSAHNVGVAVGGRDILRDVSFVVSPGEFVGVLGPSGCGKSTLLQRIVGLIPPGHCSGSIRFSGNDGAEIPGGAVGICAYLPQNAEEMLHPGLSLHEEMTCFLAVHGGGAEDEAQIEPLLDLLGLADEIDSPVSKLSGGQKRRAAMAMTLLRRPRIVLLDEPTAGLDPASDAEVMAYLRKIAENRHVTILCSTHVLGNMDSFTRVLAFTGRKGEAMKKNGRLVFRGPPDQLLRSVCPNLVGASASENMSELYETLLAGAPDLPSLPEEEVAATPCPSSGPPRAASSFRGYVKRMWTAFWPRLAASGKARAGFLAEFFSPVVRALRFMRSAPAFVFLWMPLGVVSCIRIGCADDFFTPTTGAIYFKCIIALFLLGLCHSATRLVDGRVPGRCLERLAGVSSSAYLAAKIAGSAGLCAAQTLSFCLLWEGSVHLPQEWFSQTVSATAPAGPVSSFWTVPVLFLVSFVGSLVGLSISAIVKSRSTAVNCVPVVAVVVLFFSQPNIGYSLPDVADENRPEPPAMAERISYFTPTVYPQRFLTSAYQVAAARRAVSHAERGRAEAARAHLDVVQRDCRAVGRRLASLFIIYFAAACCLLWYFEPARESQWNGR